LARYLVLHTPVNPDDPAIRQPSDMLGLAKEAGAEGASPRWLKTWSPDLHDDRIFTLWEAKDAAEIQAAVRKYGFLDHMDVQALRVQEWGPEDVLAAAAGEPG
jgi:hypothetical protein